MGFGDPAITLRSQEPYLRIPAGTTAENIFLSGSHQIVSGGGHQLTIWWPPDNDVVRGHQIVNCSGRQNYLVATRQLSGGHIKIFSAVVPAGPGSVHLRSYKQQHIWSSTASSLNRLITPQGKARLISLLIFKLQWRYHFVVSCEFPFVDRVYV